ncbi:hypothetical protein JL193_11090 [Polaribacter batillariae]|uniref:DUF4468 domain-containing protein n=1 Tax=Polaribacter batillariae TaxID=2808900 RepID=A0ABX7SR20_9FLAO|nr:hypothetical protein [Polaribacter batillariae]QTD36684.1 hypothetical protein JL193_11090 [Polaribacter batillariae]
MKMNSIKLLVTAFTFSSFMFVSCDTGNKKTSNTKEEISEDIASTIENMEEVAEEMEEEVKTRSYKMKDGTSITYNLDSKGIVGFDDWADYTVINYELADIKKAKNSTTAQRIRNMNYRIANLGNTIPIWLRTEEVEKGVAEVQKKYKELIDNTDASEEVMKENFEAFSEKFDNLKEELDETVKEYTKIHEEAIEEFNEEIKKGKIDAAIKEYKEEIKKLGK